jgi:hypothetical protein
MQKSADKGRKAVEVGSYEDGIAHYKSAVAVDPAHGVSHSVSRCQSLTSFVGQSVSSLVFLLLLLLAVQGESHQD